MDYENAGVIKKYPMATGYDVLQEELPENDTEREVLKILARGGSVSECRELWVRNGYPEEEFDVFFKKAGDWESTHMCGPGKYEE